MLRMFKEDLNETAVPTISLFVFSLQISVGYRPNFLFSHRHTLINIEIIITAAAATTK